MASTMTSSSGSASTQKAHPFQIPRKPVGSRVSAGTISTEFKMHQSVRMKGVQRPKPAAQVHHRVNSSKFVEEMDENAARQLPTVGPFPVPPRFSAESSRIDSMEAMPRKSSVEASRGCLLRGQAKPVRSCTPPMPVLPSLTRLFEKKVVKAVKENVNPLPVAREALRERLPTVEQRARKEEERAQRALKEQENVRDFLNTANSVPLGHYRGGLADEYYGTPVPVPAQPAGNLRRTGAVKGQRPARFQAQSDQAQAESSRPHGANRGFLDNSAEEASLDKPREGGLQRRPAVKRR